MKFNQDLNYNLFDATQRLQRNSRGGILTYGRNFRLFQSASISYNRSRYEDTERIIRLRTGRGAAGRHDRKPGDVISHQRDRQLVAAAALRLRQPGQPVRADARPAAVRWRWSTPAASWAATTTSSVRSSPTALFQPVSDYPTRTVLGVQRRGGPDRRLRRHTRCPTLERFYLGGENSIRGHRFRSIFLRKPNGDPVLDANGAILGGDSFVQFNLEYHFLLGGPFRLLLFGDARQRLRRGRRRSTCRTCATPREPSCASCCRCSARRCASSTP